MTIPTKMYNTGADYALSIIGGKWKPVILYLLARHPRRTGELVKQLGTSHKVLSDQLRELTAEGENLYAALRYLNYWGEQKAATSSTVKIMCTNQMKSAGDDGLCVITRQHLHHWTQEIVKQD